MRYTVIPHSPKSTNGEESKTQIVTLHKKAPSHFTAEIGKNTYLLEAHYLDTHRMVAYDPAGNVFFLQIECVSSDYLQVRIKAGALGEFRTKLQILDAVEAKKHHAHLASEQAGFQIQSPMPGKITAILVEAGQTVKAGQGLIVMEAMKMENEMRAPRAGIIQKIHGKVGDTVETNTVLIEAS